MTDLFLIGRILFGGFFTYFGMNHFFNMAAMAQYAAGKGVPLPELAVIVTGVLLVVGGVSVLIGVLPEIGAACLALFLVVVTPVMHNFWDVTDPALRIIEMGNFIKNVALLGGVLMMLGVPRPWPYSPERRRRIPG